MTVLAKSVAFEPAVFAEGEEDGFAQAILRLDERAEAVGEFLGQHRDDGADEVSGVAAALGLSVEGGAGTGRSWMTSAMWTPISDCRRAASDLVGERVVEVLGVVRVDA